jgi:hypothetical protein
MRALHIAATIAAFTLATAVQAQDGGAPASPPSAPSVQPPVPEIRGPDERLDELNRFSDRVARSGPTRSTRPVPVTPEDVTVGSEVRDSRGKVMASVEKVGDGFAVLVSPHGKVEVEFASLAKNNKGLLINMPKAKFDAMLGGSGKAAN